MVLSDVQGGGGGDIWRDSALRYAGYANEVGESFRNIAPRLVVPSCEWLCLTPRFIGFPLEVSFSFPFFPNVRGILAETGVRDRRHSLTSSNPSSFSGTRLRLKQMPPSPTRPSMVLWKKF